MKPKEGKKEESTTDIPEAFQQQAKALMEGANKHQLSYLRSLISQCEADSMKEEYSTADMPMD